VDKLGRILVQFYWDRKKKPSRRVRVAQIWAGSNRGVLFTPRVGDEVLVAYEEGDPDRPIVIGSVYNGANTVPMTLPDKKVKSGILTLSSTGGGGYNMLLFDDTKGAENVKLRTQKDLKFKALNDQEINIGVDRKDKVGNNIDQTVGTNHTINVGTKYALTAGSQIVLTVGASSITMDPSSITLKAPTITVTGDALVSISAPLVRSTASVGAAAAKFGRKRGPRRAVGSYPFARDPISFKTGVSACPTVFVSPRRDRSSRRFRPPPPISGFVPGTSRRSISRANSSVRAVASNRLSTSRISCRGARRYGGDANACGP
jgi:phage baseplate assembly protein gpV